MHWDVVTALATATGTLAVIVAAVIGLRQLREATEARRTATFISLMDTYLSLKSRGVRSTFIQHADELGEIASSGGTAALYRHLVQLGLSRDSISTVRADLAALELVSAFCLQSALPGQFEDTYLGPTLHYNWRAFRPLALAIRHDEENSAYAQHLEAVADLVSAGHMSSRRHRRSKQKELYKGPSVLRASIEVTDVV